MTRAAAWCVQRWLAFAGPRTRVPTPLLAPVAVAWGLMAQHGLSPDPHCHLSPSAELANWMFMVIAMMLPLLGPTLAELRRTTFPHTHAVALSGFLGGWLAPWLLLAVPVAWLRQLTFAHWPALAGLTFLAAAAWMLTRWHARALSRCHVRRPLAPHGVGLLRDVAREGWQAGLACCVSCGPLMLACTLTGHSFIAMVGGLVLGWLERSTYRPAIRPAAALACALGVWFMVMAAPAPASASLPSPRALALASSPW
ncbi:MAG: hypothetical protein RL685_1303 [Pseudomonadota bacterium]